METAAKRGRLAELLRRPRGQAAPSSSPAPSAAPTGWRENLVKDGIAAEVIHGNKAQNARQRALNAFRNGHVRVLVATDIVARGIDVPGVTHVINYDLPDEPEAYVHRIGRTGAQRRRRHRHHPLRARRDEEAPRRGEGHPHHTSSWRSRGGSHQPRPASKAQKPRSHAPNDHQRKAHGAKAQPGVAHKPADPARADRARGRRPRRTQRAA